MRRPGIMAPPDLYEQPPQPGLMTPREEHPAPPVDLRLFLWSVAAVLAGVELFLQLTPA
jgi:hypothetical protein